MPEGVLWPVRPGPALSTNILLCSVSVSVRPVRISKLAGSGEADKLDREKKYAEAINAFDAVCKNFPFLDILQHANRRKGEILRKVTFGG